MIGFDEVKAIGKVLQEAGKIEQYQQILELQQQLLDMQKQIYDLEHKNIELTKESEIKSSLIPEGNTYFVENNGSKDGPFCTCCWDPEHKLVRLHQSQISGKVHCPKCNTTVKSGTIQQFRPNRSINSYE